MPELYSQVLDLKEKDVFLETEVNDSSYFSVTGIPSILTYGKHLFPYHLMILKDNHFLKIYLLLFLNL